MKKSIIYFAAFVLVCGYVSCKKFLSQDLPENDTFSSVPLLPEVPFDYEAKHRIDNDMATLGRVLFYDRNLSVNNSVSCGSCHHQNLAFASPERFDRGFDGQLLSRNTPSIQGLVGFVSSFSSIVEPSFDNQAKTLLFWDGRQNNLADMVLNPILNHKEMNLPDFETLEKKLSSLTYYPELFRKAYGEEKISKEKIALALECFIQCLDPRPMVNNNFTGSSSLTFHNFNQTDTVGFTEQEKYGRFLFHTKYNCATCHDPGGNGSYGTSGLTFNANPMFNIGLDANYADPGLAGITKRNSDRGVFKVPTLQNIALTAPYMHDGRFKTLGEVLDHYSENIQPHPQLSGQFINADGTVKQLNITTAQKQALIAFLNKLTTPDFISNPMYADPFLAN